VGESDTEIRETLSDLREAAVDILTLGQYLRPTANHLAIERFVTPAEFDRYRQWRSGWISRVRVRPLVRSSYRAEQALARNNAGLNTPPSIERVPRRERATPGQAVGSGAV